MAFGYGHAYGVGYALPKRAGSGLDTGSVAVFRMPGSAAAPLPEGFYILHGYIVAADMQYRIKQHGTVAGAEDETVSVSKIGVFGIILHGPRKSGIGYWSGAHGQTRMAAVGFLHAFSGYNPDGVNGFLLYGFHLLIFLLGFFSIRQLNILYAKSAVKARPFEQAFLYIMLF